MWNPLPCVVSVGLVLFDSRSSATVKVSICGGNRVSELLIRREHSPTWTCTPSDAFVGNDSEGMPLFVTTSPTLEVKARPPVAL